MKTLKITIPGFLIAIFLIAGCVGKPISVGTVDPKFDNANIDITTGRSISASASGFQLLLLIPISINDRHERAYEILRGQAGNDYITDVKIKESWTYAFVGTVYTTTIEATAYPRQPW